jgi:glutathione S-transferase
MITVHHLNNSRSQRVLWLLEELDLEYEVKRYERDPKTMLAPASLRAVHPLGKSPVITDGALTLAESGAIVEYLVDRYGSAMPPLVLKLVFNQVETSPMPFFARPIARAIVARVNKSFIDPQIALHLGYVEAELEKSLWFVGSEFTAADIQMSFPLEAAAAQVGLDSSRPKLMGFLDRIHGRPAYRRALERGGAYDLLN